MPRDRVFEWFLNGPIEQVGNPAYYPRRIPLIFIARAIYLGAINVVSIVRVRANRAVHLPEEILVSR